jgi:hypothetical protein
MKVLFGCEESGVCREAWRKRGHDAWSNDLVDARDGSEFHIKGDVSTAVYAQPWDIIFCFFPCTYIAVSGNRWYGSGTEGHTKRLDAVLWTLDQWFKIKALAKVGAGFENPIGVLSGHVTPSQIVQPWQFGHGETKATCLWLDRLPSLVPTNIVESREQRIWKMRPSPTRQRDRSVTYYGIAEAMADQWGKL